MRVAAGGCQKLRQGRARSMQTAGRLRFLYFANIPDWLAVCHATFDVEYFSGS